MDKTEKELKEELVRFFRIINDILEVEAKLMEVEAERLIYEIKRELLIKKAPILILGRSMSFLDALAEAMAKGMRKDGDEDDRGNC